MYLKGEAGGKATNEMTSREKRSWRAQSSRFLVRFELSGKDGKPAWNPIIISGTPTSLHLPVAVS